MDLSLCHVKTLKSDLFKWECESNIFISFNIFKMNAVNSVQILKFYNAHEAHCDSTFEHTHTHTHVFNLLQAAMQ